MVNDLDHILGSVSKVRVLRALAGLQKPVSGRHAARLAGVSSKVLGRLDELTAVGIVSRIESTGQHLYSLNAAHYLAQPLITLFRAEEEKSFLISTRLRQALASRPGIISGAIFGSAARGKARPGSDLDVLLIVEPAVDSRDLLDTILAEADDLAAGYGAKLSPVILNGGQWLKLLKKRDPFALSAAADAKTFLGPPLTEISVDEQKGQKKARRRG